MDKGCGVRFTADPPGAGGGGGGGGGGGVDIPRSTAGPVVDDAGAEPGLVPQSIL